MKIDIFLTNDKIEPLEAERFKAWIFPDAGRNYTLGLWRAILKVFKRRNN